MEQELEEGAVFNRREFGVQRDDNGPGIEKVHSDPVNLGLLMCTEGRALGKPFKVCVP